MESEKPNENTISQGANLDLEQEMINGSMTSQGANSNIEHEKPNGNFTSEVVNTDMAGTVAMIWPRIWNRGSMVWSMKYIPTKSV